METLASTVSAPANAETAAAVETSEADASEVQTDGDGSAPSGTEAATPAKPKDAVQERFDKLTREKYDALRERDRQAYELERANARLAELEKAKPAEIATQTDFPTIEQFDYDTVKFNAAVAAHIAKVTKEQGAEAAREVIQQERAAEQKRKAGESWAKKEAEFIKSKPDYVDKVQNAPTLPISEVMQDALMESEFGPQIALHLVENVEQARAIMKLPAAQQMRELGRIEARMEAAKQVPKPAVSQAPAPVPKIDAEVAPANIRVDSPESDTLPDKEWTRRRNAQEQARLRKARGD